MNAAAFRTLCRQSWSRWNTTIELFESLSLDGVSKTSIYILLEEKQITVLKDFNDDTKYDVLPLKPLSKIKESVPKRKDLSNIKVKKRCHCPDCGKKFRTALFLNEHLAESTDFKRACHICASIMTRDELPSHLEKTHKINVYACKKCPALCQSLKQYKKHLINAHSPGVCSCVDCGRSFKTKWAYHGHKSMHDAKTCPNCDTLYRNYRCYLYHVKTCCNLDRNRQDAHKTKTKVYFEVKNKDKKIKVGIRGSTDKECICDYCNKTFAGKKFVCAHIQIVHMKNTHRPCPYCGKSYAAAHMTEHIKKHEEVQLFTCEHCGIVLKTKLGYIQHVRLHTGEKPYSCQFCSATFSASSRRSEHIRKNHKSSDQIVLKHTCELCPARFRLPYRLKKHVATVHRERKENEVMELECPHCGIKFGSYRSYLYHSKKHQNGDDEVESKNEKNVSVK